MKFVRNSPSKLDFDDIIGDMIQTTTNKDTSWASWHVWVEYENKKYKVGILVESEEKADHRPLLCDVKLE